MSLGNCTSGKVFWISIAEVQWIAQIPKSQVTLFSHWSKIPSQNQHLWVNIAKMSAFGVLGQKRTYNKNINCNGLRLLKKKRENTVKANFTLQNFLSL